MNNIGVSGPGLLPYKNYVSVSCLPHKHIVASEISMRTLV